MQTKTTKFVQVAASVAVLAAAFALPGTAEARSRHHHRAMHHAHYRYVHHHHRAYAAHPLTVRRRYYREPVVAADPFHGPAAIITAPVAIAGMIVSLPFRAVAAVFPPRANDPRVIVGAPVYAAGQLAQLPFYAVNSAFGVPPSYPPGYYY
jgi:hypothetical protein